MPTDAFAYPRFAMVEASSVCNFRCPLCLWTHNTRHGQLAPDTFRCFIDEARHFVRRICFSGRGEPTLNPRLFEILRAAADTGVTVDLATNGSTLLRDATRLLDSGADNINVSIEADNATDYGRYRVGGDFSLVIEGMRHLAEEKQRRGLTKPCLGTCSVIFGYNAASLERLKAFFRELGFEAFIFKSAHLGHGRLPESAAVLRRRWLPDDGALRRRISDGAEPDATAECSFLTRVQMLWNGDITRCAVDQNAMVIGNVREASFVSIWRGDRSRQAVATILGGRFASCRTCEYSGRAVTEHAHERYVV